MRLQQQINIAWAAGEITLWQPDLPKVHRNRRYKPQKKKKKKNQCGRDSLVSSQRDCHHV